MATSKKINPTLTIEPKITLGGLSSITVSGVHFQKNTNIDLNCFLTFPFVFSMYPIGVVTVQTNLVGIFSIKIDIRPNHKGDMYVQVGATKNGKGIASSVISVHVKKA